MIAVDTSALMAIYQQEPDAALFEAALFDADVAIIGAPTAFEFAMVARARRDGLVAPIGDPTTLLTRPGLRIEPWTERHLHAARSAFDLYGKGRGHGAALNFGDCMAYAVARIAGCPLLYKGEDFARTDVTSALWRARR